MEIVDLKLSDLIGLGEDDWVQVWKDLLNELLDHIGHYNQLYGVFRRVDEVVHPLAIYEGSAIELFI